MWFIYTEIALSSAPKAFRSRPKSKFEPMGGHTLATLNVVDDRAIVGRHELRLSEDAFLQLAVKDEHTASVSQAEPPKSTGALH